MSATSPQKRSGSPKPPSVKNDIRFTEYPGRKDKPPFVLLVENDYRHERAWLEIDAEQVVNLEDMA